LSPRGGFYRPQFAFATPPGFVEEPFHYSFSSANVPALGVAVPADILVGNIVLQLQNDCEFVLRAIKAQNGVTPNDLFVILKDPFGNYLSAVPIPLTAAFTGAGGAIIGQLAVPYEAEIIAPLGGFFELFFYNPTADPITPPALTLYGVNRRKPCYEDLATGKVLS